MLSWVSPRLVVYEVCEVGNPLKKGRFRGKRKEERKEDLATLVEEGS